MELINNEIQTKIYEIRDTKVMFFQTMLRDYALLHDNDLAKLYQVETKYLNRQVKEI